MHKTEEIITKDIITSDGEDEFQIRYIQDENVGIVTSRSNKSYLILDSINFWYDLIQEKYPAKQKCSCKNDYFKLAFNYIPRIDTDDYRTVEIISYCTKCEKQKLLSEIDIDYSPTVHLFDNPITYCEQPKIKYKTYSLGGYWKEDIFRELIEFLSQKKLWIYCWYWNHIEKKRYVKAMTSDELKNFLFIEKNSYLQIYFAVEAMDDFFADFTEDSDGVYVDRNVWRKKEIIMLNAPLLVAIGAGECYYSVNFSSEYIEKGDIISKSKDFCKLTKELLVYSRKKLK